VETVVQTVIRAANLAVHFYRERLDPDDRRSPFQEIDFVAERTDGAVLPVEIKFRRRIDDADFGALRRFMERHRCRRGVLVTRQTSALDDDRVMVVPLRDFLLAY
jgi:predicted AAA+ superfamily ATPase